MWKKEDGKTPGAPETTTPVNPPVAASPTQFNQREATPPLRTTSQQNNASVSQGIRIKGEVTGTENLFVDGHIEGKLDMGGASVTVGPNGVVKADVSAREVIVRGRIDGKVVGSERIQIANSGQIIGEIQCERLAIEDGAILRGKVETGRPLAKPLESRSAAASASSGASKNLESQKSVTSATPAGTAAE